MARTFYMKSGPDYDEAPDVRDFLRVVYTYARDNDKDDWEERIGRILDVSFCVGCGCEIYRGEKLCGECACEEDCY